MDTRVDNQQEIDSFWKRNKLPRLNKEALENQKRPISSKKIEIVIKNLPKNKNPGLDAFTGELYQTLKEDLMPIIFNLIQKIKEERIFCILFCEANITMTALSNIPTCS